MGKRYRRNLGRVVFMIPVAVAILVVVMGIAAYQSTGTGVLVVQARNGVGPGSKLVPVTATVSGTSHTTPFNLTLPVGSYTVTFTPLAWYKTPAPNFAEVVGGKVIYSVAVYTPIPDFVSVNDGGFNTTTVQAGLDITPVVWSNTGAAAVQLKSTAFTAVIAPGETYTKVFHASGTFSVSLLGTGATLQVVVK